MGVRVFKVLVLSIDLKILRFNVWVTPDSVSRTLLLSGDFFLGGVVAAALTKLLLRLRKGLADSHELHRATAEAMLVIAAMLRLGENPLMAHPIDADSGELLIAATLIIRV